MLDKAQLSPVHVNKEETALFVEKLMVEDPQVVEYFLSKPPERHEAELRAVIQTGVLALKSAHVGERVDYVKREFEHLKHDMDAKLENVTRNMGDYFDPEGKMPSMLEQYIGDDGKVTRVLEQYVGEEGNMRRVIADMVREWTGELQKSMDPGNEDSLLSGLKADLIERLEEIKEGVIRRDEAKSMERKTTAKGVKFEDYCYELISETAHVMGDSASNVSKEAGIGKSKEGDILIEIGNTPAKIVIELKDMGTISENSVKSEIKGAMENRSADFGMLVSRNVEAFKQSMGWFYAFDSNDMLAIALGSESDEDETMHREILLIAYKWARAQAIINTQRAGAVDSEMMADRIKEIKDDIKLLSRIRSQAKSIKKSADEIQSTANDVLESANASLDAMTDALQK